MNKIIIERAKPKDAGAVLAHLKIVGRETDNLSFGADDFPFTLKDEELYIKRQIDSPDHILYLAWLGEKVVGVSSLERMGLRMRHRGNFAISVIRDMWGKGVGSALIEKILAFASENRFEMVCLEVRSDNERAIHFYQKYGFEKICTFPDYFKIGKEYVDFDLMKVGVGK